MFGIDIRTEKQKQAETPKPREYTKKEKKKTIKDAGDFLAEIETKGYIFNEKRIIADNLNNTVSQVSYEDISVEHEGQDLPLKYHASSNQVFDPSDLTESIGYLEGEELVINDDVDIEEY